MQRRAFPALHACAALGMHACASGCYCMPAGQHARVHGGVQRCRRACMHAGWPALPPLTHGCLRGCCHCPSQVSGGGGRAWPCLHTEEPCARRPSALLHPSSHGVHPRCMLAAPAAVARGIECSATTPFCLSLILPKCSAHHSHSSSPHCEHAALNHTAPNSCSLRPVAGEAAGRARQALWAAPRPARPH